MVKTASTLENAWQKSSVKAFARTCRSRDGPSTSQKKDARLSALQCRIVSQIQAMISLFVISVGCSKRVMAITSSALKGGLSSAFPFACAMARSISSSIVDVAGWFSMAAVRLLAGLVWCL